MGEEVKVRKQRTNGFPGFLIAGFARKGKSGYLFVPLALLGPVLREQPNVFALGAAAGQEALWIPFPDLEFLDQPVRFVGDLPEEARQEGELATITKVHYNAPQHPFHPDLHVSAMLGANTTRISANAYAAPAGLRGRPEGTLLEFYRRFEDVDHRPWSRRHELASPPTRG